MSEQARVNEQSSEGEHDPVSPDLQGTLDALFDGVEPGVSYLESAPIMPAESRIDPEKHRKAFVVGRVALIEEAIGDRCKNRKLTLLICGIGKNQHSA